MKMSTEEWDFTDTMRSGEVARLWCVDVKTVSMWARKNQIPYILTSGGHHLFSREQVMHALSQWVRY